MSSSQKLTKKQKKSLAFRDRKQGKLPPTKGKSKAIDREDEEDGEQTLSVPAMEDQSMADQELVSLETNAKPSREIVPKSEKVGGGKRGRDGGEGKRVGKLDDGKERKKRKRETGDEVEVEGEEEGGGSKKKRKGDGSLGEGEGDIQKKEVNNLDRRFILFVGNLKYTTSTDAIKAHFASCDPPPTIRLLTPKPSAQGKSSTKSKGCAFLEFTHKNSLQQALKLHQSELDGRSINVELTAGGGGKSESRLAKVKKRNQELHGQRKKQAERIQKKPGTDSTNPRLPTERPQRYSKTSGVEQIPLTKRTWTVGDEETDEVHRGGTKHGDVQANKKRKRVPRSHGTGVNSIPVG